MAVRSTCGALLRKNTIEEHRGPGLQGEVHDALPLA